MPEILDLLANIQLNERPAIAGLRAIEAQARKTGAALSGVEKTAAGFGRGQVTSPLRPFQQTARTGTGDPAMKAAQRDIARYQTQNKKAESNITAHYARQTEQRERAKISFFQKEAGAAAKAIRPPAAASSVAKTVGGGGLTSGGVFGGVVSGNLAADAIMAVSRAALSGGAAVLWYSSKLEQTAVSFKTLLGSSAAATVHIKDLQQFAKTTPFEFAELTGASRRLQNVGFSAQEVIPLMRDIGNAASAAGASQEDLNGITLAMSQIAAKGKVSAEELNQLGERGIPGLKILSEQLGLSKAQVMKLGEAGQLSSELFFKAFSNYSQQNFGGAMEAQSRTFQGALSNIKDALMISAANDFKPLYNAISGITVSIADGMNAAEPSLGRTFRTAGEELGRSMREGFDNIWKGQTPPKPGEKPYSPYVTEPKTAGEKIKANAQMAAGYGFGILFGAGGAAALNVGTGLAEGAKPKSIADLRKGDDTNNNAPGKLANLNDEGKALLGKKTALEKIKDEKELNIVYADQALAIARANASRTNSLSDIKNVAAAEQTAIQAQISAVREAVSQRVLALDKTTATQEDIDKIGRETVIEATKLETQLAVARINALEQIKQKEEEIAKARRDVASIKADAFSTVTGDELTRNMTNAANSVAAVYDQFKNIDPLLARQAANAQRMAEAYKIGRFGIDAGLKAIDSQAIAQSELLRRPEQMNGFGRRLGGLGEAVGFARDAANFRTDARGDRRLAGTNFNRPNAEAINNLNATSDVFDSYDQFTSRAQGIAKNFGNLGLAGNAALAGARLAQLPSQSELVDTIKYADQFRGDASPMAQQARENAARARSALSIRGNLSDIQARYADKQLENTIAKNADIQNTVLPTALKKLDFLNKNRKFINDPEYAAEFLQITGDLGEEITPELSRMRREVAVEQAKFEAQQAKSAFKVSEAFGKSVDENGNLVLKVALAEGSESFVTIQNEAQDRATVTTRPRASNTAKRYGR